MKWEVRFIVLKGKDCMGRGFVVGDIELGVIVRIWGCGKVFIHFC